MKKLGLNLKDDWQVFRFENNGKYRFLDFMGFRFYRNRVTLRRKIFYKACRKARRLSKKKHITAHDSFSMLSYFGWIKSTDTYHAYLKYIKPYINTKTLKYKVSNYIMKKSLKHDKEVKIMGFKKGAKARVFNVTEGKGNYLEGKIRTSIKVKGEWFNDFDGFVRFIGDAKKKAKNLKPIAKIVIGDCEACRRYDIKKKKEYTHFAIFDFDIEEEGIVAKNKK